MRLWLVFVALAFVWGSSFLWIKVGVTEGLTPLMLVAYRLWIGFLFLLVVGRLTGARLPRRRTLALQLGLVGLLNTAVPFVLITWGEQWIASALASILNGLVPLFTIVIAALLLRDEPITVNRLVGLLVGFGGAVLLLGRNLGPTPTADAQLALLGELAVVLASVCYALAAVVFRWRFSGHDVIEDAVGGRRSMNPVEFALPPVFFGAVTTTLLALAVDVRAGVPLTPPNPTAWVAVVWLGTLGSGLAYVLYFQLLKAWGATRSTLVTYAMPIVGLALGVIVLRERIDLQVIAGSALIIGGIALVNSNIGQRRLFGRSAIGQESSPTVTRGAEASVDRP
jgi:drug/metabolite transporter (DMT)-like permease